jgi:filamentous hemagglutinin family protein
MSTTTALGSQWLYKLIKHSSSILFGLVLANAAPLLPAQAATEARSPITQNLSQLDSSLQDSGAGTDSLRFTPEVGPVAEPSFLVAQAITAAEDGTGTVVTQTDNTFDITGGTQAGGNLFHSFEQLGLDANQVANILSDPNITNILGRVVGGDASVINGLLQVTGGNSNLFLINPAGIVFGPNSQVITPGSFSASTADAIQIGDEWFNAIGANDYGELVGEPSGYAFAGGEPGAVINAGSIVASAGESVTLLGGVVVNTGTVETPGGTINISAVPGENLVSITQGGNLLSIALPTEAQAGLNGASQGLAAESISSLLSGAGMAGSLGVVVEDGVTKLVSTGTPIPTSAGTAIVAGTLDVADDSANGTGGAIDVLGERVGLVSANLDASGSLGGGSVRIGGDYQGNDTVSSAERTYISHDSVISANALTEGDGGQVIAWADDRTDFYGEINAQGGANAGNGGFVEVSGKQDLIFRGAVDASAPHGSVGTLLLDPEDIIIANGSGVATGSFSGNPPNPPTEFTVGLDDTRPTTTIFESQLESSPLATVNIMLEATRDIIINDLSDNELSIMLNDPNIVSSRVITFEAGRNFSMNTGDTISAPGRSLTIKAKAGNITAGALNTFGSISGTSTNGGGGAGSSGGEQLINGRVNLEASNNVTIGAINTGNEEFTNDGSGDDVDNGSVAITATEGFIAVATIDTAGSSIDLQAGKNILTGALETNSVESTSLVAKVTLVSGQGDIQVDYVDAGSGGIYIDAAGGSFRATGATTEATGQRTLKDSAVDENGNQVVDADGDLLNIYPPEFFDFLASQRYDRNQVIVANPELTYLPRRASLLVHPNDAAGDIPITIRYGDATRTIQNVDFEISNIQAVTINISGDHYQPFVLAPYKIEFLPYIPQGSTLADSGFNASEGSVVTFRSNIFPADASGLVAGIVIGSSSNDVFYGSVENLLFEGETKKQDPSIDDQRIGRGLDTDTFCEGNSNETLATTENPLTVDERLLSENIGQPISTQALNFCNREEEATEIVSDASETDEAGEFSNSVEP